MRFSYNHAYGVQIEKSEKYKDKPVELRGPGSFSVTGAGYWSLVGPCTFHLLIWKSDRFASRCDRHRGDIRRKDMRTWVTCQVSQAFCGHSTMNCSRKSA
ncbi:hypothetical protein MPTK1_3g06210 [Marchantia polymorpha subsp. ruderalis]|uniref:Uncharacterized protein n=2 Tax=Marchantia polymorpha TaxID=3197 RepID=A0AAF6AXY3_MARPO|nr:hypothetical protein MARPO_0006s0091 [Marchantia polymorpha]BBN04617.1 hypothetical protein Mp_3g06210 [Marchantia polymorpha subsp. ruderalis]|eukprot:PTQ48053.1 hypothetical protein MARPO_0006s0091 [Marchantia polymorpha]